MVRHAYFDASTFHHRVQPSFLERPALKSLSDISVKTKVKASTRPTDTRDKTAKSKNNKKLYLMTDHKALGQRRSIEFVIKDGCSEKRGDVKPDGL